MFPRLIKSIISSCIIFNDVSIIVKRIGVKFTAVFCGIMWLVLLYNKQNNTWMSDHSFVECSLDIPRPNNSVSEVRYRKLKQIDLEVFKADICFWALQHNTTQHNTTQHNTTQHNIVKRRRNGSMVWWHLTLYSYQACSFEVESHGRLSVGSL